MVFWFLRRKDKEVKAPEKTRDMELASEPGTGTTSSTIQSEHAKEASGPAVQGRRAEEIVGAGRETVAMRNIQSKAQYHGRAQYRGDDGVYVSPTPITAGSEVTIKYDGLLARSGADQIYLHYGFGDNDNWKEPRDIPMTLTVDNMWTTTVPIDIDETSNLNFCFHDSANNWDNFNKANWSYQIHNGENPTQF